MASSRTRKQHADCSQLLFLQGIALLNAELHATGRGEEPNLDRILRYLEIIADDALTRGAERVADLCCGLRDFIADLREDQLEFSLADLDLFLVTASRIQSEAQNTNLADEWSQERIPGADHKESSELKFAPEFLRSGLRVEDHPTEVHIIFPPLGSPLQTARALADLEILWQRAPTSKPWCIDLTRLERIPVAFLATLTRLRQASGKSPRELRLQGNFQGLESTQLTERLERNFLLS
jgi:hypothetical protein